VKAAAFVFGLFICAVGAIGILMPSSLVWIAREFVSSGSLGFFILSIVRIAFGLILITVAPASRARRGLCIVGWFVVTLGMVTALTGLIAVARGEHAIEWWTQQGSGILRLTAVPILVLGGFVAYACAPVRRTA